MRPFKHFRRACQRGSTHSDLSAMAFAGHGHTNFYESRGHHRHHGGGANFGVRRPLRYLTYQLDLDDTQTRKFASILNRLKTEQEQAQLDQKRTVSAVAELIAGDKPLEEEVRVALEPRLASARRLQEQTAKAIQELHAALDSDQRLRLAELLDSGSITL